MKTILQFPNENDDDLLIEVHEEPRTENLREGAGTNNRRGIIHNAGKSFEETLTPLKKISNSLINQFKDLANSPDEVEIELCIKFTASAGIILTSLDSSANLKILLKWQNEKSG